MSYPTLSEVKTYLTVTTTGEDTFLTAELAAAQSFVERHCNRVFVAATATKTFHIRKPYVDDRRVLLTLFSDLIAITTLTNGDGVVVAAADYELIPGILPYDQIRLLPESGLVWATDAVGTPISIAGSWGYAASCPKAIWGAILELVGTAYRARQSGTTVRGGGSRGGSRGQETADISPRILRTLQAFRRVSL